MPRRGHYRSGLPDPAEPRGAVAGRIGERVVFAKSSTRRNMTSRINPADFVCSRLAAELADEWVEYTEAADLSAGSVQSYQQAIVNVCRFVDEQLTEGAAPASLAREIPDLARLLASWERTLPAGFRVGSTRPSELSGALRTLLRRRVEHPDRPVTGRMTAFARAGSRVPIGQDRELDEFTRAEKQSMVRAAWVDVIALEKRLAAGWELAATGRHPASGSWTWIPDLLWGLAGDAITPKDINANLPHAAAWPERLLDCIRRPDGTIPRTGARTNLSRWLAAQLWPTTMDLHPFRVLLMDATGHPPEEVSGLSEDDVEFTPGGVRLTLTRKRAQRRYYRSFKDASAAGGDVTETKEFTDAPRREASVVLRRLMAVTAEVRAKAADPERKLFVRVAVDVDVTLRFSMWNPEAPLVRFSAWLERDQIAVVGKSDIRRLRKATKVEKVVAARGHIADAADDHHVETFKGHYAQGTTLRVISGEVINEAQEHWFHRAVDGPTVVTGQPASAGQEGARLQALGLSQQEAEALIEGELDMGVTHCKNPYDSPFSPAGQLCAVAPLRCLECRNAWVLPSQLPQLLLFRDHLERVRTRLSPARFTALWGQSYANLRAVLAERTEQEIALARKHITADDVALDLPLSAHVEFDA